MERNILTAREKLNKQPRVILSNEFAERVNLLAGIMSDEQPLAPLVAPWHDMAAYRVKYTYEQPSPEWREFMFSLDQQELSQFTKLLDSTLRLDAKTVGDLRELHSTKYRYYKIGQRGKNFAVVAFRKNEQLDEENNKFKKLEKPFTWV